MRKEGLWEFCERVVIKVKQNEENEKMRGRKNKKEVRLVRSLKMSEGSDLRLLSFSCKE